MTAPEVLVRDAFAIAARFAAAGIVAREAGQAGLAYFHGRDRLVVERKSLQNEVSAADRALETLIRGRLEELFPNDAFFGEEGGRAGRGDGLWVVDPIDGTACFVNGIPVWCVSIAFVVGRSIEIGVIYDPNSGELFAARRGGGATVNGRPIRASAATSFADGAVGIGYSTRTAPKPALDALTKLLDQGGMFQRNGSGALMLAYVAAGRLIGYYEPHINAWDCLAGIVLIREAGGWVNDFLKGDGLDAGAPILGSAPGVAAAMRAITGVVD